MDVLDRFLNTAFAEQYTAHEKLRQAVAELPYGHNLLIMSKISDFNARTYYMEMTRRLGWSRKKRKK